MHPNSLANLKPFQPGQSGHPGGRKRGASIVHEIERRLAQGAEFDEKTGELVRVGLEARSIAQALIEVSEGKRDPKEIDVKAALAIMERVDGPVRKEVALSGELTQKRVVIEPVQDTTLSTTDAPAPKLT